MGNRRRQLSLVDETNSNGRLTKEYWEKHKLKGLTQGQDKYIEAIDKSVITLCYGLVGSGKSYIAVGKAVEMLLNTTVKKIVFSRPAVECGEKLGFLPGDLSDKISPYMRPIQDILQEFIDYKSLRNYIEKDMIEFCPLGLLRGRSLHNACLVLDEAQNANYAQLKMFMTRLGRNSRMIISGDITQSDLPQRNNDYWKCIQRFNENPQVDGICVVQLCASDIVRNELIEKIILKFRD